MHLPKLAVGDKLVQRDLMRSGRVVRDVDDTPATVTAVGRKWGTAAPDRFPRQTFKFDLVTGYENSGQYTSRSRVGTPEMFKEEAAVEHLITVLRDSHGIRLDHAYKLNSADLAAILTLVMAAEARFDSED